MALLWRAQFTAGNDLMDALGKYRSLHVEDKEPLAQSPRFDRR